MMTHRERILAVLENREPDKLPWIPRLDFWYKANSFLGTMDKKYAGKSLREIQNIIGVGHSGRGTRLFKTELHNMEIVEENSGACITKTYITPKGTVREKYSVNLKAREKGVNYSNEMVEHMIKDEKDYAVVEYIIENTKFVDTFDEYLRFEKDIGTDGVLMCPSHGDPMYSIMQDYIGFNKVYYELADNPEKIERLFLCRWEKLRELHELFLNSPAKIILHGAHFDSMMTPPPIFKKYMTPYFLELAEKLAAAGKVLAIHADADSKLLLSDYLESNIRMVECFCTSPMVSVTFEEAVETWGKTIIICGGIPSTLLVPELTSHDEFLSYVKNLLETIRNKECRVILGVADNVMPEADIKRVEIITEMLDALPVS